MAENYAEHVRKGFDILHPKMAEYIAAEMQKEYKERWWSEVLSVLEDYGTHLPLAGEKSELMKKMDVAICTRILRYGHHFKKLLSKECINWAGELLLVRNNTAHTGPDGISKDYADRALDTMARVCDSIHPESAEEIRALLRELRYGDARGSVAGGGTAVPSRPGAKQDTGIPSAGGSLPSWREVITPHPDVAAGRYLNAEFAANLDQVARGQGVLEYSDPVEFFGRTYITEGIKGLLLQSAKRLTGGTGEPVLQLKTAFGGGKTHSLLALYHMARGAVSLDKLPNLKDVLTEAGIREMPKARVAVIVGTAIDPAKYRRPADLPGVTVNTMWGEIAAQLAISAKNPELYNYVKEADKKGVSPGSQALTELFDTCGPCLILLDELVAYAKKIYDASGPLPSGSFDCFITFIQELTEAASASKNSMVVASIPESEIEIGEGEGGKKALAVIEHTFGRKESIWTPVTANEGFEVVRRRLFLECKKPEERDRVCAAFSRMYQDNPSDFPVGTGEVDYYNRLVACYPVHPEVFDRLYEEWATLEHFQRTRGVLRMMAAVIYRLWIAGDSGSLIMPGSISLNETAVREEFVRYLTPAWNAIIDAEVDGERSVPYSKDKEVQRFGSKMAARRVARTIMLGSAPTAQGRNIRGIEASSIRLGVVQPGDVIADFNDALNTLDNSLTYLYSDPGGSRYWYDTIPTLRKTARDRQSQVSETDAELEIEKRLKELRKERPFGGVHACPSNSADVDDEQAVRLVILRPSDSYRNMSSEAVVKAKDILENRGSQPRMNKNMLAFVAADADRLKDLMTAVKELLAWQSIKNDSAVLNLTAEQNRQTDNSIDTCKKVVDTRLKETFCRLLVPYVDRDGDLTETLWSCEPLPGNEPIVAKAARKMLQNELVIDKWGPALLRMELDKLLWKEKDHIRIKELWECLTRYCYLPRLADYAVLEDTIKNGAESKDFFALASSVDEEGYKGLRYNKAVQTIYKDDYLVKVSAAENQLERESQKTPSEQPDTPSDGPTPQKPPENDGPGQGELGIEPPKMTRFYMSAKLDNTRVIRDVQKYMEEVVNNLTLVDGCRVEITLEVSARADEGFTPDTVRAVKENCNTLHADSFGFEES